MLEFYPRIISINFTISRIVEGCYKITGIILKTEGVSREILCFETVPNQQGFVSQYEIALKTTLVFENYSHYFITSLNNP